MWNKAYREVQRHNTLSQRKSVIIHFLFRPVLFIRPIFQKLAGKIVTQGSRSDACYRRCRIAWKQGPCNGMVSVCHSVCLSQSPAAFRCRGLAAMGPASRRYRISIDCCPTLSSSRAAANYADSATLLADVGIWTQTCYVCWNAAMSSNR